MEWNGNIGMENGRCQDGMEDFKNGMEDNLPYCYTNSILDLKKNIYGCQVVINNIVAEVFPLNIYAYQVFRSYLSAGLP